MKKFALFVLAVVTITAGCKSEAERDTTGSLLDKAVGKIGAAIVRYDEDAFNRAVKPLEDMLRTHCLDHAAIEPHEAAGCAEISADPSRTALVEAARSALTDTDLQALYRDSEAAIADQRRRVAAEIVLEYWEWIGPVRHALNDLDAKVGVALEEDTGAEFGPSPAAILLPRDRRDKLILVAGWFAAQLKRYEDAAPQGIAFAREDIATLQARIGKAEADDSAVMRLRGMLLDEADNDAWSGAAAPSRAPPDLAWATAARAAGDAPSTLQTVLTNVGILTDLRKFAGDRFAAASSAFTPEAADQLLHDCAALLQLDESAFDEGCTPAYSILETLLNDLVDGGSGGAEQASPPRNDGGPVVGPTAEQANWLKASLKTFDKAWAPDGIELRSTGDIDPVLRQRMIAALQNRIRIATRSFAEAAYQGHLSRLFTAEESLKLAHDALAQLADQPLPRSLADPLSLLDRDSLIQGANEWRRLTRILNEATTIFAGSSKFDVAQSHAAGVTERLVALAEAPAVDADLSWLLKNANPDKMKGILTSTEQALLKAVEARLMTESEFLKTLPVDFETYRGPRGPPTDPYFPRSGKILEALSDIVRNPTDFVRKAGALRAEHTLFYELLAKAPADVRSAWAFGEGSHYTWLSAQMSPGDLARFRALVARMKPAGPGAGWVEIADELKLIDAEMNTEQNRRKDVLKIGRSQDGRPAWSKKGPGGPTVSSAGHPPGYPPGRPPSLARPARLFALDNLLGRAPGALELQNRVATMMEIYPETQAMPQALLDDLRRAMQERLGSEMGRLDTLQRTIGGPDGLNARAARSLAPQKAAVLNLLDDAKAKSVLAAESMAERLAMMERVGLLKPDPKRWAMLSEVRFGFNGKPPPADPSGIRIGGSPKLEGGPGGRSPTENCP